MNKNILEKRVGKHFWTINPQPFYSRYVLVLHVKPMVQEPIDLGELARLIDEKKPLCICGKPLTGQQIDVYDHDGGRVVKGYKEKQWVSVHCMHRKCHYDMSLWKIERELE
jgi:hypothetical protein